MCFSEWCCTGVWDGSGTDELNVLGAAVLFHE